MFVECYEGIPVRDRLHTVTVDSATGKIIHFSLDSQKETLSLPAPILTYTWEDSENAADYVDAFTGNYVKIPIEWNDEE